MTRATTILTVLTFIAASESPAQMNDDEATVWRLEEAYYRYAKANDPEGYLTLFHEDVIGWPTLDAAPKGKSRVSQWIATVHENPDEAWNYELKRMAIHSFGDVVVVHYLLRDYFVSRGSGEVTRSAVFRISHTWQRAGDTWRIISGMGGRLNAEPQAGY